LVAEVVDVKARRQSTEPWGRTPRFYRGDGCEKSNRPPRSPSLPRYTTTSRRGICARDPYPFPPKSRRTFRLPEQTRTLFPQRGYGSKSSSSARLGPGVQGLAQQSRRPSQRGMGPRAARTQAHKPQGSLDPQSSPNRANPGRIPTNGILEFPLNCLVDKNRVS